MGECAINASTKWFGAKNKSNYKNKEENRVRLSSAKKPPRRLLRGGVSFLLKFRDFLNPLKGGFQKCALAHLAVIGAASVVNFQHQRAGKVGVVQAAHHVGVVNVAVKGEQVLVGVAPIVLVPPVVVVNMGAKEAVGVKVHKVHGAGVAMLVAGVIAKADFRNFLIAFQNGGKIAQLAQVFKGELHLSVQRVFHQSVKAGKPDVAHFGRIPARGNVGNHQWHARGGGTVNAGLHFPAQIPVGKPGQPEVVNAVKRRVQKIQREAALVAAFAQGANGGGIVAFRKNGFKAGVGNQVQGFQFGFVGKAVGNNAKFSFHGRFSFWSSSVG